MPHEQLPPRQPLARNESQVVHAPPPEPQLVVFTVVTQLEPLQQPPPQLVASQPVHWLLVQV